MPNIALIFKNEIMRLARKEVKRATGNIYASVKEIKQQNSALKKRVAELERQLMVLQGKNAAASGIPATAEPETPHTRLGASSIRKLRARLKLNRHDMALLLDVNQNSIFLWEQAKAKPRAATRAKIIALRAMKKNAVLALLSEKQGKTVPAENVKKAEKPDSVEKSAKKVKRRSAAAEVKSVKVPKTKSKAPKAAKSGIKKSVKPELSADVKPASASQA